MFLELRTCLGIGLAFGAGVSIGVCLTRRSATQGAVPQLLPIQVSLKGSPATKLPVDAEINKKVVALASGHRVAQCLYTVCVLDIATILSLEQRPLSTSEIADEVQKHRSNMGHRLHVDGLQRVMRLLAQHGVFSELAGPRFELTDLSQRLRTDVIGPSMRSVVLHNLSPSMWRSWAKLPDVLASGEELSQAHCAFSAANGMANFAYKSKHPECQQAFDDVMTIQSIAPANQLIGWGEFAQLPTGTKFCDIGGNLGELCSALKQRHPHLEVTNFDMPHVVAAAPAIQGVQHRPGDLFKPETIPQSDVILMKKILHDWNDNDCGRIIKNVASALPGGGMMLIVEFVLPDPGTVDASKLNVFNADVQMLTMNGSRERLMSDWKKLLEANGFELVSVSPLGGVNLIRARKRS